MFWTKGTVCQWQCLTFQISWCVRCKLFEVFLVYIFQVEVCLASGIAPPRARRERLPIAAKMLNLGSPEGEEAAKAILKSMRRLTCKECRSVNRTWHLHSLMDILPAKYHSYKPGCFMLSGWRNLIQGCCLCSKATWASVFVPNLHTTILGFGSLFLGTFSGKIEHVFFPLCFMLRIVFVSEAKFWQFVRGFFGKN